MNINKILCSVVLVSFALNGCASVKTANQKEPVAKGRWIAVNPYGYVPPNTDVYFKKDGLGNSVVVPNDNNSGNSAIVLKGE